MSLNDIFCQTFFRFYCTSNCWAAVGLVSLARFWLGGGADLDLCVCFINKSSNYTSCYSTLQHTHKWNETAAAAAAPRRILF